MLIAVPVTLLASAASSPPATPGPEAKLTVSAIIPVKRSAYVQTSTGCRARLFTPGIENRTPFAFSNARIKPARMMLRP